MPTYDYTCKNCGYNWEEFQSIKETAIEICPKCKEKTAQKLIGRGAGVIFKGKGFYETDYRRKGEKNV